MQQFLEWSDAYSVAHPALDAEHRKIVAAIGEIAKAVGQGCHGTRLRSLLCDLKETALEHFRHENALLHEILAFTASVHGGQRFLAVMGEAVIEEHIGEHAHAASVLDAMIRDTLRDMPSDQGIEAKLVHWFVNHAVKHDAHLKTVFQTIESDCPELLSKLT